MWVPFGVPVGWGELLKRALKESIADNCFGLAAQLAYYFFLSLFPALLVLVALAGLFPWNLIEHILATLAAFAPAEAMQIMRDQVVQITKGGNAGLITFGILGALWSSSAAMTAIVDTLNRAYGVNEGRPWWKVQAHGIVLTIVLSLFVIVSFTLVVAGPEIAEKLATNLGLGPAFEWTWKIVQWPVVFLLVSLACAIVYYMAPDVEQRWLWILPGAVFATVVWFAVSLAFRFYVTRFGHYNQIYGAIGGVMVLLLWFYVSGLALLVGAELNSELEHASPFGKADGEKVPGEHRGWMGRWRHYWLSHPAPKTPTVVP